MGTFSWDRATWGTKHVNTHCSNLRGHGEKRGLLACELAFKFFLETKEGLDHLGIVEPSLVFGDLR